MSATAARQHVDDGLAARMAESALLLTVRRVLITVASGLSAALIARLLGPARYGPFASAMTICTFALATVDFGFGIYLSREMARQPMARSRLLSATLQVQLAWAVMTSVAIVVLGLLTGGTRGAVLLVVAPSILASGLAGYRQIYYVTYRIRSLTWIDVPIFVCQSVIMAALAAIGGGAVLLAVVFSATTVVNAVAVAVAGRRIIVPRGGDRSARSELMRLSTGPGVSSLMATVYFGLDLVILGWLVDDVRLGQYGVAVKILSILVLVPGLVMSAVLPGLALEADDPHGLGRLAARVWHWLLTAGLPIAAGVCLFAKPIINDFFGPSYAGANPSLRILSLAAAVALLSNLTGSLLMARRLTRPQLVQNSVAITVNFVGNMLLVPRFGIAAAAWLTVASECIVVAGGLLSLSKAVSFAPILEVSRRPVLAVAIACGAGGLAMLLSTPAAVGIYVVALVSATTVLKAWPAEFSIPSIRPRPLMLREQA
jgi:O-antigen/teichoic acid export membrane protein